MAFSLPHFSEGIWAGEVPLRPTPAGQCLGDFKIKDPPPGRLPVNPVDLLISFFFVCFRLRKLLAVNENEYFTELQLKEEAL